MEAPSGCEMNTIKKEKFVNVTIQMFLALYATTNALV